MRHSVPLPEAGLLAFPFLFEFFFQKICPAASVPSVDEFLWSFDANFGYPQQFLGRLLISVPGLFWACKAVWSSLPLLFVILYLCLPEDARRRYLAALVCTAAALLPLYVLCPGAGPVYLFRDSCPYPDGLPIPLANPQLRLLPAGLPLNTTPSGHVAWALLLLRFAIQFKRKALVVLFGCILAGTVVATLALGEHYVIDLILSVPFAAAIWALIDGNWKRCGWLMGIVALSLLGLRQGWGLGLSPVTVWVLCAGLIAISVNWKFQWIRARLDRAIASCASGRAALQPGPAPFQR